MKDKDPKIRPRRPAPGRPEPIGVRPQPHARDLFAGRSQREQADEARRRREQGGK